MRRFRILVAYDGTGFHGWQVQPGLRTVQGEVMNALDQVFGAPTAPLHAAGRTDAGVHARGQVASFASDTTLPAHALAPLLNRALPRDVRVRASAAAAPEFHARHSARARRYVYRLLREDDVLLRRHAWWPRRALDAAGLERATAPLEGVHDCTSLRSMGSSMSDPRCHIHRARWSEWEGGIAFDIAADHFLYHMVRNVVAVALAAARTADPAATMSAVLSARSRSAARATVPAAGLCLEQVYYDGDPAP